MTRPPELKFPADQERKDAKADVGSSSCLDEAVVEDESEEPGGDVGAFGDEILDGLANDQLRLRTGFAVEVVLKTRQLDRILTAVSAAGDGRTGEGRVALSLPLVRLPVGGVLNGEAEGDEDANHHRPA